MQALKFMLIASGIALWVLMAVVVISVICEIVQKAIAVKKRRYEQKHRFDKPPTAKCYCIDCRRKDFGGQCDVVSRYVADNWFCNEADPKTK